LSTAPRGASEGSLVSAFETLSNGRTFSQAWALEVLQRHWSMKKAAPSLPLHPHISRVIWKAIKLACTRTAAL
jgi:hypothetical protein